MPYALEVDDKKELLDLNDGEYESFSLQPLSLLFEYIKCFFIYDIDLDHGKQRIPTFDIFFSKLYQAVSWYFVLSFSGMNA